MIKVGISGCLGCFSHCRYDGGGFDDFDIGMAEKYLKSALNKNEIIFIPVCPEQLGGLSTPRIPSEIIGGDGSAVWNCDAKVITKNGIDITENFKRGALQVLEISRKLNIEAFILKERSPSCGVNEIYSGKFDGSKVSGSGVTCALLKENEIRVFSDEDILRYN